MALGTVARIGGGWPWGLLSGWWCSRRRPVCPAVSGRGGTIPRSRAQVRGVFPGGRAHRAAVDLQGEGSSERVEVSRWGCRLSANWRSRSSAAGRFALVTTVSSGTARGLTPTTQVAHPDPGHRSPTARVLLASTAPYRSGPPSGSGKAQLSPDYGSGGWGFESLAARQRPAPWLSSKRSSGDRIWQCQSLSAK